MTTTTEPLTLEAIGAAVVDYVRAWRERDRIYDDAFDALVAAATREGYRVVAIEETDGATVVRDYSTSIVLYRAADDNDAQARIDAESRWIDWEDAHAAVWDTVADLLDEPRPLFGFIGRFDEAPERLDIDGFLARVEAGAR